MTHQEHIRRIHRLVATYPACTGGTKQRPEPAVVWVVDTPRGGEGQDRERGETVDRDVKEERG